MARADLVDRRQRGERVAELGARNQKLEAGAGDAGFALTGGGAQDDAVVGVDRFEDVRCVVADVGGGGTEDELGVPFDGAVVDAWLERGGRPLDACSGLNRRFVGKHHFPARLLGAAGSHRRLGFCGRGSGFLGGSGRRPGG